MTSRPRLGGFAGLLVFGAFGASALLAVIPGGFGLLPGALEASESAELPCQFRWVQVHGQKPIRAASVFKVDNPTAWVISMPKEIAMNKPKCQIRPENYAKAKATVYYGTEAGYPRDAIRRQLEEIRIHCGRYMCAAQWIPIIHRAAPRPV